MAYSNALEYLVSKFKEERDTITEHLARGNAVKDFADYQRLCGIVQGLDFASLTINDLAKRLENDADE
jgi:hypothetical protein